MSKAEPFDLDAWLHDLETTGAPPPIVQAGALVLRRRALEVPKALLGTPSLLKLLDVMVEVMRAAPGVGLAAPQIGVPLRIYVAEDQAERLARASAEVLETRKRGPLPLMAFINPAVTLDRGEKGEAAVFFEGCLSVRGYGALVARAPAVHVEALDPRGAPFAIDLEGWPARIMQHEMDHLNGTLYTDRMVARSFAADDNLADLSALPVSEVIDTLVNANKDPKDLRKGK
jgi:peptide deformylase